MWDTTVTLLRLRLNNRKSIDCRKIDPSNKITYRERQNEISCRHYYEKYSMFKRVKNILI